MVALSRIKLKAQVSRNKETYFSLKNSNLTTFCFLSLPLDCAVLGCRLVLIMEDLLWVLTDDQLKAALHFADSLSGLLKRATEETQKIKGARKLEVSYA